MGNTCCQCSKRRSREERYKKAAQPIPSDILKMLCDQIKRNEDLLRILFSLSKKCVKGKAGDIIKLLESNIDSPDDFKKNVEKILQETKTEDNESEFKKGIQDLVKLDISQLTEGSGALKKTPKELLHLIGTVCRLPEEHMQRLQTDIGGEGVLQTFTNLSLVSLGSSVTVGLALSYLSIEVGRNIFKWWKCEITGEICVKNIIDSGVGVAAGIAGGIGGQALGAAIGSLAGPGGAAVGFLIGGLAGGLAGFKVGKYLSDMLTQQMFGLSKEKALENAYKFLEVSANSSNMEINSRYRKLALKYHPDKGGDRDKWAMLQFSLELIKAARKSQN